MKSKLTKAKEVTVYLNDDEVDLIISAIQNAGPRGWPADHPDRIAWETFKAHLTIESKARLREGKQTEGDLRERLIDADAKLKAANQEYQDLMALSADAGGGDPDSVTALQRAMTVHQAAMNEYNNAWAQWTEFRRTGEATASDSTETPK